MVDVEDLAHAALGESPPLPDVGMPQTGVDDEFVPRPPPLRDGVPLTLSYSDHRWPGCVITESVAIDDQAGLLMWWRHVEPGEDDQDLPQASGKSWHWGGCWNMSEIVGVRYTTMFGDPGREFLKSGSRGSVVQISLWERFSMDRIALLLLNPLSFTFGLAILLAWQLSEIFPRSGGQHNMADPANETAMHTSIATAAASAIFSVVALWWLGVFSYCAGPKYKGTHLGTKTTSRWWWQKVLSELTLEVFFGLCVVAIVVCIVTEFSQEGISCHDRLSDAGRRLQATNCIKQVGLNQTCGVNGCYCGVLSDLLCDEPPLPKQICVKITRPLCAAAGTDVLTSGMHEHLFNIMLATIVLSVFIFLIWMVTAFAMVLHWMGYQMRNSRVIDLTVKSDIEYHRFTLIFDSPSEESLVFNVESCEDPEAIALTLSGFDP